MQDNASNSAQERTAPLRRVTLTVDPDDYSALELLGQQSDVSASWLVRRAIREFLERRGRERIDPTARVTKQKKRVEGVA